MLWTGTGMIVGSGACFAVGGAALVAAWLSARLRDWQRAIGAAGIGALLTCAGVCLFWLGSTHPTFNLRNNQGFPSDWSCSPVGEGEVCGRDVPLSPPSHERPT